MPQVGRATARGAGDREARHVPAGDATSPWSPELPRVVTAPPPESRLRLALAEREEQPAS
jgi:hypothetical protein